MLEKYVHALVQRVPEHLEDLLMQMLVLRGSSKAEICIVLIAGQRQGQRAGTVRAVENAQRLRIALGRSEGDRRIVLPY